MRSSIPLVLLSWSVGTVVADSTSTTDTGSSCAAQQVLDACLALLQPQLAACPANNWDCMCTQSNNVLTCYNNCPNDSGAFGAQQVKISYCNAASAYPSSTSTTVVGTNSATQPSSTSDISATSSPSSSSDSSVSSSGSSSSSAATPSTSSVKSSKGAASELAVEVGSLLAAMILGIGAAL